MDTHAHLSTELLELVEAGEIPLGALLPLAVAGWPRWGPMREWLLEDARRRVRADDPRAFVAVDAGLLTLPEVDRYGEVKGYCAVEELRGHLDWTRLKELRAKTKFRIWPPVFDALLGEVRRLAPVSPEAAAGWLDLAEHTLLRLRGRAAPRSVVGSRELLLAAHRADLARRRGDLEAAAAGFAAVAADAAKRAVAGLAAHAEIWVMEAATAAARGAGLAADGRFKLARQALGLLGADFLQAWATVEHAEVLLAAGEPARAAADLAGLAERVERARHENFQDLADRARGLLARAEGEA